MNKLVAITLCAIISTVLFSVPTGVFAQSIGANPLSIVINPTYPAPYEPVSLRIDSSSLAVINGTFTVSINGGAAINGIGTNAVTFTTTGPGTTMRVLVTATINDRSYQDTAIIRPAGVALVVEPLATAPVLYPGTPIIPSAGNVRVVAVPSFRTNTGAAIPPSKLSYVWHIGNQTLNTSSGIGRSAVVVPAPLPYRNMDLSVVIQTQDGTQAAKGSVVLTPGTPVVRIYKNDPLMGTLYNHALFGTQTINSAEVSFVAKSYGISISSGLPALVWYLNGNQAQTGNSITVRPQGSGQGSATLSVTATKEATYENATSAITIKFGKSSQNMLGIFGL